MKFNIEVDEVMAHMLCDLLYVSSGEDQSQLDLYIDPDLASEKGKDLMNQLEECYPDILGKYFERKSNDI